MSEEKAEYNIDKLRREFAALRKFAAMESASQDVIGVKKIYIDMTEDIKAAMVLDELIFWTLPRENKISGLRVWKDGVLWLAVSRSEWWERKRLTERQADSAIHKLIKQNLVVKNVFKFNNFPTMHLRLNVPVFFQKYAETLTKMHPPEIEEDPAEKQIADLYEMMGFPFSPNGNNGSILPNGDTDLQNGESVSPNGENINIPPAPLTQPSQERVFQKSDNDSLGGYLDLLANGEAKEKEMNAVRDLLETELHYNFPNGIKAQSVYKRIAKAAKKGQELPRFIAWVKSDEKRLSYAWVYAKDPETIWRDWPQAFSSNGHSYEDALKQAGYV